MSLSVVNETQLRDLRGKGESVVVDFYADWCHPCHALAPEVESLASKATDVRFVKVDVDADPGLAQELGILGVPTVVHFAPDGAEVARSVGAVPAEQLALRLRLGA